MKITFRLNNKPVCIDAQPNWTLLKVLRDIFGLTGAKEGCGSGECGTCTVLIDGKNVPSCLILIGQVEGKEVLTIEGLGKGEELDVIQKTFAEKGAVQCGFCTPGMIMSVKALLNNNPKPTREEIKEGISGNICRCTGYEQIIEAVEEIVKKEGEHE